MAKASDKMLREAWAEVTLLTLRQHKHQTKSIWPDFQQRRNSNNTVDATEDDYLQTQQEVVKRGHLLWKSWRKDRKLKRRG